MTSPTAPITTVHVDKPAPGSTDGTTSITADTKGTDAHTTLPDHDNMHAGTPDINTVPERRTTPHGKCLPI